MSSTQASTTNLSLTVVAAILIAATTASQAQAYDAATTNAGLTQRAVVASTLHEVLARRLGRPLGLFEPLLLGPVLPHGVDRRLLWGRLMALDPAAGYRPSDDGMATAVAWTMAGSVIAKTPPERLQNMFFDPSTKMGLRDAAAFDGFGHALRLAADTGGLRALATGTSFSMEGLSSLEWLEAPTNDQGLPSFLNHIEHAVAAPDSKDREVGLVQALLALGGILTVLEDAGNPAQVRNDFRAAYLQGGGGSAFERASTYERAVSDRYGVLGVPAAKTVVRRPNWKAYFTGTDGQGLADRTQRRFFSDGTVPQDVAIDPDTTALDVMTLARESLTYELPTVPRLELRPLGQVQYVFASDGPGDGLGAAPRAILAYERVLGRVRFFLDQRVHADVARTLLPEISGYGAGLVDHLFRARVDLSASGGGVQVRADVVTSTNDAALKGRLRLLAEDAQGTRRELAVFDLQPGRGSQFTVAVPSGAKRVAAVLRAEDGAGPLVAFGVLTLLPAKP